jgi:HlyD family secretion protein
MMSRINLAGALALGILLLATSACASNSATNTPVATPPPTAVSVTKAARGSIEATLSYPGNVQTRAQVPIVPEVAGRVKRLTVDLGSAVKVGDVLAELDTSAYDLQVAQAEAALAGAQAKLASLQAGARTEQVALAQSNYDASKARLDAMKEGGRPETVAQAEANYKAALARLEQTRKGATPEQLAQAEANVRLAHNNEYYQQQQANTIRDVLNNLPGDPAWGLRDAQLGVAWEQSKIAEAKLAEVQAGATAEQLTQLEMAAEAAHQQWLLAQNPYSEHDIAQAQAAVDAAAQQLALAGSPYTANDLNAAKAAVQQAQVAVDLAKLQRQKATITSPLEGVVAQKLTSEGSMVGPAGPLAVLVSRDVEITVQVEEARLSRVRVGQAAVLTVAAYPGEKFAAEVSAIAPSVDQRSRTAQVKIRPKSDPRLLDGMFAQVSIVTGQQANALLVPSSAVVDRDGRKVVFVNRGGVAELREVKLGFANGAKVEVVAGVADGEEVVTTGADGLTNGQPVTAGG